MTKWILYPDSGKPSIEGDYVVRTGAYPMINVLLHTGENWISSGVVAYLPDPIPDYEPSPEPTTIEWERIPDGYSAGGVIVLHEGRPVSAYCSGPGREWMMSYNVKILEPQPRWMMKEQS